MQKNNWEELIRSDILPFNTAIPLHSIQYSNEYIGGPYYRKLFIYYKDGVGYYYENFSDHYRVGRYCLNLFLKNSRKYKNYLKFWHREFKKFDNLILKLRRTKLSAVNVEELSKLLEKVYKKTIYWHGVAYNVDAIDTVLPSKIEQIINKSYPGAKKSELARIYNILTFPDVLSYSNRMNLDKLLLMQKLSNKKAGESLINKFIEEYYWVNFKWGESKEYTKKDFKKERQEKKTAEVEKETTESKKRIELAKKEKKEILKKIKKKHPIIEKYINIFDEYAILHDLRKEGQMKSAYYLRLLYKEVAKRFNLKKDILYFFWPNELIACLKDNKKIDLSLAEKRSKKFLAEYFFNGKLKEYFEEEADRKRNEILKLEKVAVEEISGTSASQGRIIGTAKICLSARQAQEKIKPGDILVTGMTMPEFINSMKIAGAIVTDEGGLTCHAAIISRELGKPCVVGTKISTRVIKDGDRLEVNANHGVVKVIAKNSQNSQV